MSAQTQTSLTLSWTASTDNVGVTGYDLYQCHEVGSTTAKLLARGPHLWDELRPRRRGSGRGRQRLDSFTANAQTSACRI